MSMMIRRHKKQREAQAVATLSEASANDNTPLTYTRTDIVTMKKDKLITVAKDNGIADAESMSGNALKTALIDKLGL